MTRELEGWEEFSLFLGVTLWRHRTSVPRLPSSHRPRDARDSDRAQEEVDSEAARTDDDYRKQP